MPANDKFKDAMSLVPTSVAIAWTKNNQGEISGCTISSFISVSVEKENEAIAFVLRNDSRTATTISELEKFKISILSEDQVELANIFSRGLPIAELNSVIGTNPTWIYHSTCEFTLKLQQKVLLTNSTIFIADVLSFIARPNLQPLIYSAREYL